MEIRRNTSLKRENLGYGAMVVAAAAAAAVVFITIISAPKEGHGWAASSGKSGVIAREGDS